MHTNKDELIQRLPSVQKPLVAYIRRTCGNAGLVEDILQETMFHALQEIHTLRDPDKLLAWMKTIALNQVRMAHRAAKLHGSDKTLKRLQAQKAAVAPNPFEEFDRLTPLLASAATNISQLLALALHFAFGFTPGEIAAITGTKRKTVYSRIAIAKDKIRRNISSQVDSELDCDIKVKTIVTVWFIATRQPLSGPCCRNRVLARQAYEYTQTCAEHFTSVNTFRVGAAIMSWRLAQLTEYASDEQCPRPPERWQRNRWDRTLLREAHQHYQRALSMDLMPLDRCQLEAFHLIYTPPTHDAVDWRKALTLLLESAKYAPRTTFHLDIADAMRFVEGPLPAVRYLENHLRNMSLLYNPATYFKIGHLLLNAGKPIEARRNLRKCNKLLISDGMKRCVSLMLASCETPAKPPSR